MFPCWQKHLGFTGLKAEKHIFDSASSGKFSKSRQVKPCCGAPGQAAIWASQLSSCTAHSHQLIRRLVEAKAREKPQQQMTVCVCACGGGRGGLRHSVSVEQREKFCSWTEHLWCVRSWVFVKVGGRCRVICVESQNMRLGFFWCLFAQQKWRKRVRVMLCFSNGVSKKLEKAYFLIILSEWEAMKGPPEGDMTENVWNPPVWCVIMDF